MSLVGEWDIIGTTRENSSIYLKFVPVLKECSQK